MKLYKVHTKSYNAYVVAADPSTAEKVFVEWLDNKDYGYSCDRVVLQIDCIADTKCLPGSLLSPVDFLLGQIKEDEIYSSSLNEAH